MPLAGRFKSPRRTGRSRRTGASLPSPSRSDAQADPKPHLQSQPSTPRTAVTELDQAIEPRQPASPLPSTTRQTRGRMGRVAQVQVLATGSYAPDRVVTNDDLAALGCDSDWIVRRTGILERRWASPDEATSDLCYRAAMNCLQSANVAADQVDLIIVATITPDHPTPSTACHLQRRLGATAAAMDLNAACAGFMYAYITAAQFVAAGNSRYALVVGADLMSRTIDPNDQKTYPLFGDGAGAALIGRPPVTEMDTPNDQPSAKTSPIPPAGILAYQLGSEGCGGDMLCIPAGGTRIPMTPEVHASGGQYLRMDGRNVFKWAVKVVDESAKQVLSMAEQAAADVDLVVLHQANQRIIDAAVSDLDIPAEKLFVNLDRYGNTSAASIPLALDEVNRNRRMNRGDLVLLCGFGAGLAWGTALVRW